MNNKPLSCGRMENGIMKLVADEKIIFRTEKPEKTFCYTPSIIRFKDRLIVTLDIGGEKDAYYHEERYSDIPRSMTGVILVSDDNGETFVKKGYFPYYHARLIVDGEVIYIIGHNKDIMIKASYDGGETWSESEKLTEGKWYCMAATGYLEHGDFIYVPCEEYVNHDIIKSWEPAGTAPILLRAKKGDDLLNPKSWTIPKSKSFVECFGFSRRFPGFGIPFWDCGAREYTLYEKNRAMAPVGWLESNVVKIYDKDHVWYDENAFHIFMRSNTGGTGYCNVVKAVEKENGSLVMEYQKNPSLEDVVFLPMPGGQMKFRVVYDKKTKLYWLVSTQAVDSMTDVHKLPENRYNLPNDERQRLQLHFSKNMVDWCFAGIIAMGNSAKEARHYADCIIDGDDLLVVSRSGDENSSTAHNGNIITLHRVKDFRNLVY